MNEEMSNDLYERAVKHMPGGVNSPVRAYKAVDRVPRFIASAKGDRITDVDGNEMIDYICSWGPGILGHAHDRVIAKVKEAAEAGLTYGAPTKKEVEMAELIYELIPTMEVSRLVSSGTEAVMSAIRVAGGYTGRDKIIKFRGCYHGHSDGLLVKAGSAALTTSVPDSAGVPADYTKNTLVAEYNDCDSVKELFDNNKDEIAADYLVKKGVPFREAHGIVGQLVLMCIEKNIALDDLSLEEYKAVSPVFDEDIYEAISLQTCVDKRLTLGAPGPEVMNKVIAIYDKYMEEN